MPLDSRREVPFAPLNLTLYQQQHCQDLTFQLLDRTLRSFDERDASRDPVSGSPRHHASLDSTRWKQLRTQTNASLYSERTSDTNTPRDLHLPGDNWDNPCVLLAVGTIESNLSEVMFGLETPDFLSIQVRSETLGKQPLDGVVLAQLAGLTEADPFQFMGVTWMVGEQSWPLNKVVRPRDFIIVTATGVVSRPNGERIGYEVAQSIDLPQCPALPKPMIRGKLMYGAIYRQIEKGVVDVYNQMYVEPQGRLMDKLVIAAMWGSTLGCHKYRRRRSCSGVLKIKAPSGGRKYGQKMSAIPAKTVGRREMSCRDDAVLTSAMSTRVHSAWRHCVGAAA